jgi:hypothetical protein
MSLEVAILTDFGAFVVAVIFYPLLGVRLSDDGVVAIGISVMQIRGYCTIGARYFFIEQMFECRFIDNS